MSKPENVYVFEIRDKEGNTVAQAPLICDDPVRALEIWQSVIQPNGASVTVDIPNLLNNLAVAAKKDMTVSNYWCILVQEQQPEAVPA